MLYIDTHDGDLARPPPDIPLHGSARIRIHKPVRHVMLPEQEAWLETNVFAYGKRLYGARDKSACRAMRAAFHDRIRLDTMTPLWLEQKHISTWLAKRVKDEKQKRTTARTAGATATKKRRTTQTQGKGKGKGKGKEKETSSKGKVRNVSKKRAASESDEESEEEDMEEDEVESELSDMDETDGI